MKMSRRIITLVLALIALTATAQEEKKPFRAYLFNKEYEVFLSIDFYAESITVPGQELYGSLPGYLGKKRNSFCWLITSAKVKGSHAELAMINDYGSEDLTATLSQKNDSVYILKQEKGSTLKVPQNGKWQKLPKVMEFKRQ